MINQCYVYWIHNPEETNIHEQGYVGITNNLTRRLKEHKRKSLYKDQEMIVEVYLQGERSFCEEIEILLRPQSKIGMNKAPGGKAPPNPKGRKLSEETRRKMSLNNAGMKGKKHSNESRQKMSVSHKGKIPWNKGKKMVKKGTVL